MPRQIGSLDLELLEQLFEGLPEVPFFVKDTKLRYVAANPAMARLCGVRQPAQVLGKRAQDFFPPEFSRRYEAFDQQVMDTGKPIANRLDLAVSAGAQPLWLLFTRIPVRGSHGEVLGVAASARRFQSIARTDPIYRRISRVISHIQTEFAEPLRLTELAEVARTSVSQLERDFANLFGATPHAVLTKIRINRALELLSGGMTISAIALECGFSGQSAFARVFREAVGASPRAYRALLLTRQKEASAADTPVRDAAASPTGV